MSSTAQPVQRTANGSLRWTEEYDAEIRRLAEEGAASISIARLMTAKFRTGFTKNMVIGRGKRLGIVFTAIGGPKPTTAKAPRPKKAKPRDRILRAPELADQPLPPPGTIVLNDTGMTRCKWPLWPDHGPAPAPDQQFVCGAPTVGMSSWCGEHANRSVSRVQEATGSVHREFRKFSTITGAVA